MIIARERTLKADNALTVIVTPVGYHFVDEEHGIDYAFDHTLLEHGSDLLMLCVNPAGRSVRVWGSELANSRDGAAAALFRQGGDKLSPYATIGIGPDPADYHLATRQAIFTDAPDNMIQIDARAVSTDVMLHDAIVTIAPVVRRYWAKVKLHSRINTQDSLAALEGQVDLLQRLVLTLIDSLPAAQRPVGYELIAQALEPVSTLGLKSPEDLLGKVADHKQAVRRAQREYFAGVDRG